MKIRIQLTDIEKLEAIYAYLLNKGIITPDMRRIESYLALGEFTYTTEPEETPDGN